MLDNTVGGNDTIEGGSENDLVVGDGHFMRGSSHGSDYLYGGDDDDRVIGDGFEMYDDAAGGSDHIYGGDGLDTLWGDATHHNNSRGGNDWLWGGKDADMIFGDATGGDATASGGDDKLWGGGNDVLYGDFMPSFGCIRELRRPGGKDLLDGGTDNDLLWGGGGNDTFAFGQSSGVDWIFDFTNSAGEQDRIDVSAYGISSFSDLTIHDDTVGHSWFNFGTSVKAAVIELSPSDQIIVVGIDKQHNRRPTSSFGSSHPQPDCGQLE